jgi:large subunit ribosomal protein L9
MSTNLLTIELLTDIAHIGHKGEIIQISSSQARNMLIPKWLAREITADRMKQIKEKEKKAKDQARIKLEKSYEIQKLLDGQKIEFTLQWKNGKIFGGINEHEVITRIKQKWHVDFDKHDVKLPNKTHIKTAGTHLVYLHITRDTIAKIIVEVKIQDA